MRSSTADLEPRSLAERVASPSFRETAWDISARIRQAQNHEHPAVLELFEQGVQALGVDAGVMLSAMRDEDSLYSLRMLLACDPGWMSAYVENDWVQSDPWLRHAARATDTILSSALPAIRPEEREFIEQSKPYGFGACVIAPIPTALGAARYGVLVLGSARDDFFDDAGYPDFCIAARMLAGELHLWLMRFLRHELLLQSNLAPSEIALLREEALGHGSKQIGQQLGVEPTTIDCRFQRLNRKLNARNRSEAMRIAALYGLFD